MKPQKTKSAWAGQAPTGGLRPRSRPFPGPSALGGSKSEVAKPPLNAGCWFLRRWGCLEPRSHGQASGWVSQPRWETEETEAKGECDTAIFTSASRAQRLPLCHKIGSLKQVTSTLSKGWAAWGQWQPWLEQGPGLSIMWEPCVGPGAKDKAMGTHCAQ